MFCYVPGLLTRPVSSAFSTAAYGMKIIAVSASWRCPILHFVNAFTNVSVNAYIPDENDPLFPPVDGIVNAYLLIISDDFYTRRPSARWPGTPFLPVIPSISRGILPDLRPGAATARSIFSISSIQKGREGNCRVERLRMLCLPLSRFSAIEFLAYVMRSQTSIFVPPFLKRFRRGRHDRGRCPSC